MKIPRSGRITLEDCMLNTIKLTKELEEKLSNERDIDMSWFILTVIDIDNYSSRADDMLSMIDGDVSSSERLSELLPQYIKSINQYDDMGVSKIVKKLLRTANEVYDYSQIRTTVAV